MYITVKCFIQRQEENIRKRDSLITEYAAEYEFEGRIFSRDGRKPVLWVSDQV